MPLIKDLSFERWLDHAFDHPESDRDWAYRPDTDHWADPPERKAEYIARTFAEAERHLARFSPAQIDAGIETILRAGGAGDLLEALAPAVPLELRLEVMRSCVTLFRLFFAVRCPGLDIDSSQPIYRVCGLFWTLFPSPDAPPSPDEAPMWRAKVDALTTILGLDSLMCQYSALGGLSKLHYKAPDAAVAIVDAYLARHGSPDFPLRDEALAARVGRLH